MILFSSFLSFYLSRFFFFFFSFSSPLPFLISFSLSLCLFFFDYQYEDTGSTTSTFGFRSSRHRVSPILEIIHRYVFYERYTIDYCQAFCFIFFYISLYNVVSTLSYFFVLSFLSLYLCIQIKYFTLLTLNLIFRG